MYLIVNADDYGYSKGVTDGIIYAHKHGIVTSTSAMVNMDDIDYAVKAYGECPELGLGIHLTLTAGKPVGCGYKTIVDENGYFYTRPSLLKKQDYDINEIEREYEEQIKKFKLLFGKMPDHIDMHHNVNDITEIWNIVNKLSQKYDIYLRRCTPNFSYYSTFYDSNASKESFMKNMQSYLDNKQYGIEMACHPAFVDYYLYKHSSYNHQRIKEIDVLIDEDIKKYLNDNNIVLTNYSKI